MKKTDRKLKKAAQKVIKENIKASLVSAIKHTTTDLVPETAKIEKQILKGSGKLAKKIARLIRPAEPAKKAAIKTATLVKEAKIAPAEKSAKKVKAVQAEPAK